MRPAAGPNHIGVCIGRHMEMDILDWADRCRHILDLPLLYAGDVWPDYTDAKSKKDAPRHGQSKHLRAH